jgi:type IV pilus assembly protein PilN
VAVICGLLGLTTALGVGYWHWSLTKQASDLDQQIEVANAEQARVRTLLAELKTYETRRATLQQRVQLIEQLRGGQSVPVQLLDHVSRSLPDLLWLTSMVQEGETMTLDGRSNTLFALSDFVGNLGNSSLLQKPIEIVNSQVEPAPMLQGKPVPGGQELIRFTVKAQMAKPSQPAEKPAAAGTAPAAPAAPTAPAGKGA